MSVYDCNELKIETYKGSRHLQFKVNEVVKVKDMLRGNYGAIREVEGHALFREEELEHMEITKVAYYDDFNHRKLNAPNRLLGDRKTLQQDSSFIALIKKMFRFKDSIWRKSESDLY